MKKFSCVLVALATIVMAAPTIASAKDMMHKGGMGMHHRMHHKMHHMGMMHHKMMMKKPGM